MIVDLRTGLSIPDKWVELLRQLQKEDPTAVLAGGAIRDIYLRRKPIKDLDFFIKKGAGFPQFSNKPPERAYEGSTPYVSNVMYYPEAIPLPINVVVGYGYESTYQLLETFDFGLCQIAFDGTRIIKTWAFEWDQKHCEMTMRLGERQQQRQDASRARFERWREKYPEFRLVENG